MSLSSVRSETALRSRLFSSSRSFRRFTCSLFCPQNSGRHREYVTSLTPIWRIASAMACPCETRTSTWRSFATISSGLYRFLAIAVLLDVKDIPQVGPLQWGWIKTRTSTWRSFATISSGLYRFLAIAVLLDVKDIPQVGPLQWGWINATWVKLNMGLAVVPIGLLDEIREHW